MAPFAQEIAPAGPRSCALPDAAANAAPPGGATAASRQESQDAAADGEQWGFADGDPFDDACELIGLRLLNPAGAAAATMALRPHLQVVCRTAKYHAVHFPRCPKDRIALS